MQERSRTWLEDVVEAGERVREATATKAFADYQSDWLIRAAIERMFEVMGEALARVERADLETVSQITDYRKVIGFRNRIAHNYDDIEDEQVWEIVQAFLPRLLEEVNHLLDDPRT